MLTRIHVDQHNIRNNHKHGTHLPVISAKDYRANRKGHRADLVNEQGEVVASVVYSPDNPLSCGARVWIETRLTVEVTDHAQPEQAAA